MKQKLLVCCLLALLPAFNALAYDFELDGLYYTITSSNTACVEKCDQNYEGYLTIPETVNYNNETYNVTEIGDRAFYYCNKLNVITAPGVIRNIGSEAFMHCTMLYDLDFSYIDSLQHIGVRAFYDTGFLQYEKNQHPSEPIYWGSVLITYNGVQDLVIKEGTRLLADYSCCYLTNKGYLAPRWIGDCVTSVTMPSSLRYIGNNAFYQAVFSKAEIPEGVISIGDGAFERVGPQGSSGTIRSVIKLPTTLKYLGSRAFSEPYFYSVYCTATTPPISNGDPFDGWVEGNNGARYIIVPEEVKDVYKESPYWQDHPIRTPQSAIYNVKDIAREYGEENPELKYDKEIDDGMKIDGIPLVSCDADELSPVGTYPIKIEPQSISFPFPVLNEGTLTVTKAPLTVKVKNCTRERGQDNPEFELSYMGWKNGEDESVLTKKPVVTTTATPNSPAGTYLLTVSGGEAQNYEFEYEDGLLIVTESSTPTDVVITAQNLTMVYGDEIPSLTYSTEGASLVGVPSLSCEATPTSPVGVYPIIVSKGTVENQNVTFVNGTLTITKAPLTITAGTYTKKQGEAMPEFTLSYTGFKNGETKDVLTKQPTVTCEANASSAPGEYSVTVSGAEAQNYEISYVNGKLIVTEADAVVVRANSYTREYGDANPVFGFTSEGASLDGTPEIVCEATATSPVGTYDIVVKQGTVKNNNVTYVAGTLTITKAPLNISTGNYTIMQGDPIPEFTLTYTGFKNNETKDVLTKQTIVSCSATETSGPGEYPITLSGAEAQNYNISYTSGMLTITQAGDEEITKNVEINCLLYDLYHTNRTAIVAPLRPNGYSGDIVVPGTVTYNNVQYQVISIEKAFGWCSNLTSISIPEGVTTIDDYAFATCGNLVSINIPSSVMSIGECAFYNCSSLTAVSLPNNVKSIGSSAFRECIKLENVTLGNSLTSLGIGAFFHCSSLMSIIIPNSVKVISQNCFYQCTGLTSVVIPDGVETIDVQGFCNCSGLKTVTIPNSVKSIGTNAFRSCSSLESVVSYIKIPYVIDDYVFYEIPANAVLHVPYGTMNAYQNTAGWSKFSKIVEMESEPIAAEIGSGVYYLFNPASGKYLCGANSWGTQASLEAVGVDFRLQKVSNDNGYSVDSYYYNTTTDHYLGWPTLYIDQPVAVWYFVQQEDGSYIMTSNGEDYLAYDGTSNIVTSTKDVSDTKARWMLMTRQEIIETMAGATSSEPFDASLLIAYPDFGRSGKKRCQESWSDTPTIGGENENWCAEKFDCTFDVGQTLTGLPNGHYKLMVQGFYREGADANYNVGPAVELCKNGNEHLYAHIYANEQERPLMSIFDEANEYAEGYSTELGIIPNSMNHASNFFSAGLYWNEVEVDVTDGSLTIGIKKSDAVYRDWTCFDSFRLYYLGNGTAVGISAIDDNRQTYDVYTTTGLKVRHQTTTLKGLPKGIYVVNGRKVVVK